ncbi:TetR/AcrR family transcriptional regulator [Mycobacterium deserti]|uniref:TetR/AcrR family transcriptional regulator n=1 Tax=Mycobacterium deserti TaxID=2978347 RepID=A0ABT2MEK6_9MYCO|nr:TetR/AcrR family transcriptional regulator [Mycobacterium deserti]MCT7660703.1 TetR/AcrR family transcriptional regulator [Mycobacterium deserti]
MVGDDPAAETVVTPPRRGRNLDRTRDAEILDAALEVLVATGYLGLTVEMVAVRANSGKATIYRRWRSKDELILDAAQRMPKLAELDRMPDTGTLRGDLLGLFDAQSIDKSEQVRRMTGDLAATVKTRPAIAAAVDRAVIGLWVAAHRRLIERAVDRGEISTPAELDTLCHVVQR